MEIKEATAVTAKDANMRGKIPNSGESSVGYQYFPKTKSLTDTLPKMGRPSIKRKTTIRARVVMDARTFVRNHDGIKTGYTKHVR